MHINTHASAARMQLHFFPGTGGTQPALHTCVSMRTRSARRKTLGRARTRRAPEKVPALFYDPPNAYAHTNTPNAFARTHQTSTSATTTRQQPPQKVRDNARETQIIHSTRARVHSKTDPVNGRRRNSECMRVSVCVCMCACQCASARPGPV